MQEAWPQRPLVLYSGDNLTAQQLADSAFQSFSISIKPDFKASHSWNMCMCPRHPNQPAPAAPACGWELVLRDNPACCS